MKKKVENTIYNLLNPSRLFYVKKYHVTEKELDDIYRIMHIITSNKYYYKEMNNHCKMKNQLEMYNDELFQELCKLGDKRYLYVIDENLVNYICSSGNHVLVTPSVLMTWLNYFIDYKDYGNKIYDYISNFIQQIILKKQHNNFLIEKIISQYISTVYAYNSINHRRILNILLGYLYINRNLLEDNENIFNDINDIFSDEHFYETMMVNGAIDKEANVDICVYYIEKAIDILNDKRNKIKKK